MLPENTARDLLARAADTIEVSPRTGDTVVAAARRRRRARTVTAAVATAAAVVGIAAVSRTHPLAAPPGPAASPSAAPSQSPGRQVRVPVLAGYPEDEALKRVQQWGLTAEVLPALRECRPAGWVVGQRPRVGRLAEGSAVTLVVSTPESGQGDCPEGVAFESDRRTASLIYRFSRGEEATPPTSPEVSLGLAGTDGAARLRGRDATERERWRVASSGSPDQPVDVLEPLASTDGDYRVDLTPRPACPDADRAESVSFTGLRHISITPAGGECGWALDVSVNEVGQIEDVVLDRTAASGESTAPASAPRPCRADDVVARFRPVGDGGGGHMITWVRFRNVSDSTCVLEGYPDRVVASEPGLPDVQATNGGGFFPGGRSTPMAPGETTDTGLETATVCEARPGGGPPGPAYHRIAIELPGGTMRLVAPERGGFDVTCGLRVDAFFTSQDP